LGDLDEIAWFLLHFAHACNQLSGRPEEFTQSQLATDANVIPCHCEFVVDHRIIHHQKDRADGISIQELVFLIALLLEFFHPGIGHIHDHTPFAKVHRSCWTGFNTGRQKTIGYTVEAHGALGHYSGNGILSGYIVRTGLPNLLKSRGAQLTALSRKNNRSCGTILDNGSVNVSLGSILARRLETVPTLVGEKVPVELAPGDHLPKPHQFEGAGGEICWVLETTPIEGLGGLQFVPFFAGYLTTSTGRTFCCVYEKRFVSHTALTSF